MSAIANPPGGSPPPEDFNQACEDLTSALDRMCEADDHAAIDAAVADARAAVDVAAAACRRSAQPRQSQYGLA